MRKGYGPTGVSYPLPFERFVEMARRGIRVAISARSLVPIDKSASEEELRNLYDESDCVCYVKTPNGRSESVIPKYLSEYLA